MQCVNTSHFCRVSVRGKKLRWKNKDVHFKFFVGTVSHVIPGGVKFVGGGCPLHIILASNCKLTEHLNQAKNRVRRNATL